MSDNSESEEEEVVLMYMLHKRSKLKCNVWVRQIFFFENKRANFLFYALNYGMTKTNFKITLECHRNALSS